MLQNIAELSHRDEQESLFHKALIFVFLINSLSSSSCQPVKMSMQLGDNLSETH